ncbi:hypothetical protein DRQ36_06815 [bacterium]|nr:MAG: hypothetical protein DRQ36_06815 [bacterium]
MWILSFVSYSIEINGPNLTYIISIILLKLTTILITLIILISSSLGGENWWRIRFGLYTADSLYTDDWNYAGAMLGASDGHDVYDFEKFYPPTPQYAILFFPHREPAEPDYWPAPYNRDYASDIRAPLTTKDIWYMKLALVYTYSRTVTIWWDELDSIPADYLPILISPAGDSINLFVEDSYTGVFPPGVQRWQLSVEPDYYDRISVYPDGDIVRVGETRQFRAYLHHGPDSLRITLVGWEYHGTGGTIDDNGLFEATFPGGGYIVANIGGVRDSSEITVNPGGTFFDITVHEGWNLISLPATPSSNYAEDIFPGATYYIYTFDPVIHDYIIVDTLSVGKGYFLLSYSDETFSFVGTALDSLTVPLFYGWNMVGSPGETVTLADFSTFPPGIILHPPFVWNEIYEVADSLEPTQGCWILSGADGELTITTD